MTHRWRRAYDHRIKEQIIRAGNPDLLLLEIPRSTALSWIRRGLGEIVSLDHDDEGEPALRDRVAQLERRIAMLTAVLRLVLALLRVSGFKLELSRVPSAAGKRRLLGAIERARRSVNEAGADRGFVCIRPHRRSGCAPMLPTRLGTSMSRSSSCSTA